MELLNVITARSIWLFDIAELNPRGISVFPDLFNWAKQTYHFEKSPKSLEDVDDTKALAFSSGTYKSDGESSVHIAELKLYNDGIVASTQSSTHETDRFLEDLLRSLSIEFGLAYHPEIVRKKLYLSELQVKSDRNLDAINPNLGKLASIISEASGHDFEFAGISFWPRQSIPPVTMSAFQLERKVNTDRDESRYFSRAPLHTDAHLEVLKEIESRLML